MKSTLISLIALGAFTVAAAADPTDRAATSGPMVLSAEQLDGVTAGIALLLPAVQQAREAAKTENASNATIPSVAIVAPVLQEGIGDNKLFIAFGDVR